MPQTILSEISNLVHWNLFGIWCLVFGAFTLSYILSNIISSEVRISISKSVIAIVRTGRYTWEVKMVMHLLLNIVMGAWG